MLNSSQEYEFGHSDSTGFDHETNQHPAELLKLLLKFIS